MSKRVKNIWPFDLFSRSTVRHLSKKGRITRSTSTGRDVYKGYRLYRQYEGWTVPELDKETIFDTKGQAKRFIREWTKREGRENEGRVRNPSMLTVLKYGKNGAKSVKKGNADTVRKFLKRLKNLEHYTVWEPNKQAYPGLDAASWLSYNDYLRGESNPSRGMIEHTIYIKNPADWFARCVEGVERSGSGYDPKAVCGAVLKRKKAKEGRAKGRRNRR